ncbi:MAG: hypothetical protein V4710_07630, partial [Verrucomicrobiota bacterium]
MATAADFYVDLAGSNVIGTGSQARPWRSIQHAVNIAPDGEVAAPTVIHVGPGEYAETADGSTGQLLIADKHFIRIEGAGPSVGAAGTRI